MQVIALLLLGGAGTRLWPLSTEQRPKQFLKLFDDRSLFQVTLERLRAAQCEHVVILTNAALTPHIRADLAELSVPSPHVIVEPVRRDSGPAIAAGVAYALERWGGEAIVAALPSDHLIRTDAQFAAALRNATAVARSGHLVTFGVPPTYPATTYGYIERGRALSAEAAAFAVAAFHEKPDADKAETYLRSGRHDWNSGMFVFSAKTFAQEAAQHMPDIWESAQRAVVAGAHSESLALDAGAFGAARKTSIDYALFEKSRRVAVVPAAFTWSDVGDWGSLYDALDKDANGNVVIGDVKLQDCTGTLALAHDAPLAIAGLTDMVAVSTRDGTFMAPRTRAPDVKKLIGG
jgi:mannose-1-phosphate guanylyltransferase/mannose-6-phosphate isomerase